MFGRNTEISIKCHQRQDIEEVCVRFVQITVLFSFILLCISARLWWRRSRHCLGGADLWRAPLTEKTKMRRRGPVESVNPSKPRYSVLHMYKSQISIVKRRRSPWLRVCPGMHVHVVYARQARRTDITVDICWRPFRHSALSKSYKVSRPRQ